MVAEVVGDREDLAYSLRQFHGPRWLPDVDLDNCKFISAEASNRVDFPHTTSQAAGRGAEALLADRMAQRVVACLEVIEIESRQLLSAARRLQCLFKSLAQRKAVR